MVPLMSFHKEVLYICLNLLLLKKWTKFTILLSFHFCQYLLYSIVNVDLKISDKIFEFSKISEFLTWPFLGGNQFCRMGELFCLTFCISILKSFKDPNSSSFFRFPSIQHDSGVVSQVFKISAN